MTSKLLVALLGVLCAWAPVSAQVVYRQQPTTGLFSATIIPTINDGAALGTGALSWSDLFLASGGVINWNNGDVTLTHSADTLTLGGGNFSLGSGTISGTGAASFVLGSQAGSAAIQAVEGDITLAAGYGSSTATAPVYAGGVMGNVLGTNLTLTENIIGGVIGKYDITGTNASTKGKAAVIGTIGDQASSADAAFLAILGGDTGASTPGAAFAVMHQNSTVASKFSFGLDLYRAAIGSYSAVTYGTAAIRLPNASWIVGRNAADSANLNLLQADTNNQLTLGVALAPRTTIAAGGTTTATVSGVLSMDTTAVGNVGAGVDDLMTYTLPANTLSANGKMLRVTTWGTRANGTITLRTWMGGVDVSGGNTVTATWMRVVLMIRTGAGTQEIIHIEFTESVVQSVTRTAGTLDETTALIIKTTGISSAAGDNDVVQRGMVVEVLN